VALGLIIVGLFWLISRFLPEDLGHYGWPFFIIVPGLALVVGALLLGAAAGERLIVLGSIVTITGLLLFVQNLTELWATWAYAWALIFPTAMGLGWILYGAVNRRPALVRTGTRVTLIGLVLFLAGAFFFEEFIGLSGYRFGRLSGTVMAAGLIGLGVILLLANFLSARKGSAR
jgi:hypothetical protein